MPKDQREVSPRSTKLQRELCKDEVKPQAVSPSKSLLEEAFASGDVTFQELKPVEPVSGCCYETNSLGG